MTGNSSVNHLVNKYGFGRTDKQPDIDLVSSKPNVPAHQGDTHDPMPSVDIGTSLSRKAMVASGLVQGVKLSETVAAGLIAGASARLQGASEENQVAARVAGQVKFTAQRLHADVGTLAQHIDVGNSDIKNKVVAMLGEHETGGYLVGGLGKLSVNHLVNKYGFGRTDKQPDIDLVSSKPNVPAHQGDTHDPMPSIDIGTSLSRKAMVASGFVQGVKLTETVAAGLLAGASARLQGASDENQVAARIAGQVKFTAQRLHADAGTLAQHIDVGNSDIKNKVVAMLGEHETGDYLVGGG